MLGIDANADAVTYASERALAAGLTNTCFRVADAASLEAAPPAASAAPPAARAAAALPSEHDGGAVASLREWHAADGAELCPCRRLCSVVCVCAYLTVPRRSLLRRRAGRRVARVRRQL